MTITQFSAIITAIALGGCISITTGNETPSIPLIDPALAARCESVGQVNSTVRTDEVKPNKVHEQLVSLAKLGASKLGGNAIAPLGSRRQKTRRFGVYHCDATIFSAVTNNEPQP